MAVTVYTAPSCMGCKLTKRKLAEMRVPYREIDISTDQAANAALVGLGYKTAPVVAVERGEHLTMWQGYRPDALAALIDFKQEVA
jgi:glutaredoxin-like protein NrdH